jgi:rhodanese-related sulfurtransferase
MAGQNRQFKNEIYAQIARIGKSLSSGPRLELLDLLCQGPRTVEVLAKQAGLSVANTSRHLQVLRGDRLVVGERKGVHVRYRIADEAVSDFYQALRRMAEGRLLEIDRLTSEFLGARGALEAVDREVLIQRVRDGAVTVLDVRPAEEFAAGHLPGAVSVPLDLLDARLAELPEGREVVAYCRGPYCVMAIDAVERLRGRGFVANHLDQGVPEWRAMGFPVEVSVDTDGGANAGG